MKNKYTFGFDLWGLILFLIIMLPNIIWFAIPAPVDALRKDSVTIGFDMVGAVFQSIMIAMLVLIKNAETGKVKMDWALFSSAACVGLYLLSWVAYYCGVTHGALMVAMCIVPCMAFGFYIINRKNYLVLIPLTVFTFCHTVFGVVNFVINSVN